VRPGLLPEPEKELTASTQNANVPAVRLAAVGDVLLATDPAGQGPTWDAGPRLEGVRGLLTGCDVVVGNLECALPGSGKTVPTEPRVVANPRLVRSVLESTFHVVSLANNHAFDCLQEGYHQARSLLESIGVPCFGAGDDLDGAAAPAILAVRGSRIAFLGAVDARAGARQVAGPGQWGVAPLDVGRMAEQVRCLRREVDHVVVSLHWGEERLLIPSPNQIEQAHALAEAGTSLVLGHHSHVIQGMEVYRGVPIIYSLGTFLASEVPFTNGDVLTWNRTERTGCVLTADLTEAGAVNVQQVPTYDSGKRIEVDRTGFGTKRIARANQALARGVTPARYRREFFRVKTIKPVLDHLRWSELKRLRLRNLCRALSEIRRAREAE